jgi:TonB family protein
MKISALLLIIIISTSCKTKEATVACTVKYTPIDTNDVFMVTEVMAKYKDGTFDILNYIQSNFVYPKAQEYLQTKAIVKFIVNRQGMVSDAIIANKSQEQYTLFDKEAIRVLTTMPAWATAKQEGVIVKQQIILPIQLEIK